MTAPGVVMPNRLLALHSATLRTRDRDARRLLALVRVLGFIAILLLPMQMRAGADHPHPHALLQLVIDARDGTIDHHADDGHADSHADAPGSHSHDVPRFGESNAAGSGIAILAAVITLFAVPNPGFLGSWPLLERLTGRLPTLEPPPPRVASV